MGPENRNPEEILQAAVEIADPAERASYLEQACGGNETLRSEMESLLKAHEDAGTFLDSGALGPIGANDCSPLLTEGPGTVIGRYKLLERIGEGGMAVVYLAEQTEPIRRKVALKIIKLGMDTRQVIARFEAERQALALMDHPSIAKVFDAGATETGRPYFVMELVQGVSITEYCDKSSLSTKDRLALFLQVCNAVQHAHQKGIIHRDIKPSNVMVTLQDGQPIPKVIDFGIAKATNQKLTEKTLFTRYAHIIGTPAYMSPEQAELSDLDVDTRSDIYSLGVLLYELLTGTTPFSEEELRKASYVEMQRMIREQEPIKPSTRIKTALRRASVPARQKTSCEDARPTKIMGGTPMPREVRGDLDWIVMKTLEKDRTRRYETASGLAEDILRHLNHEPVQAAAPSTSYRLGKFVRRHRLGVLVGLAAALLTSVTICALAVSTVRVGWEQARTQAALEREQQSLRQETQARQEAEQARAQEQQARVQAEQARAKEQQARTEAERQTKIAQAVAGFFNRDLLASVSPERARGRPVTVREILDSASQKIGGRFAGEPLIEASIRDTLGNAYRALGHYEAAERHFARGLELVRAQLGPGHSYALTAMNNLAELYTDQGRYQEARPLCAQVLEASKRVLGEEHPHTLAFMNNLAKLSQYQGQYEEAAALYRRVLEIRKGSLTLAHPNTLATMQNLASLYCAQGRRQEAEVLYRQTLEIEERVLGTDHPSTLIAMGNLAALYVELGQYGKAEELDLKTLKIRERVLGKEHPATLVSMNNLAHLYGRQRRYEEAQFLCEQALETSKRVLGEEHPNTLTSMTNLAELYRAQRRHDDALPLHVRALEIKERVLGPEHPDTLASMNNLAELYKAQGRYQEAKPLYDKTLEISTRVLGAEHPNTLTTMNNLAGWYVVQGRYEEAEPLLLRTLRARTRVLGQTHPSAISSVKRLAELYEAWGKPEETRKWQGELPKDATGEPAVPAAEGMVPEESWKMPDAVSQPSRDPQVPPSGPAAANPPEILLVGKPAPDFTLTDLNGRSVSLSDFKGKVVLLTFWASWCQHCAQAIVQLERLHQKYREQGLVVLGLNHESNQADVRKFAQIRISYPVLLGATRPCQEYGARLIPAFFYVDREGIVRYQENGFSDGRERDIEARIRELLGSGPGPKDKPPG